jgi:phosphatidylglycerophosphate synthase
VVPLKLKARDAWWTVILVDPIAGWLVRAVYPVRAVTPNLLTALSALLAAVAVLAFALGQLVLGAVVFQASFVVDCMDGKLAFTRDQRSRYGGFLDVAADTLRFAGCATAIAYAAAPDGSRAAAWTAVLALYPAVHFGVIVTGAAWPDRSPRASISVDAAPLALLRAAPSRLGKPGSTVDAEAVAFTIGPIVGHPLAGIAVAVAFNACHLLASTAVRMRRAMAMGEEPA